MDIEEVMKEFAAAAADWLILAISEKKTEQNFRRYLDKKSAKLWKKECQSSMRLCKSTLKEGIEFSKASEIYNKRVSSDYYSVFTNKVQDTIWIKYGENSRIGENR